MGIRATLLATCLLLLAVSMWPAAGAAQNGTEAPTFSETIAPIVYKTAWSVIDQKVPRRFRSSPTRTS